MKIVINRSTKIKALTLLVVFISEMIYPVVSYALTGGPSQPEVQSFEPVGTSEMVDVFSGDFNYNIPLLDVNGYPVNIAYHAGVSMDQESSWVGLGWNINPGTINRGMRGLPDDMNGEGVTKETYMKTNWTLGLNAAFNGELFGKNVKKKKRKKENFGLDLSFNLGMKYNSYKGMGYSFGSGVNFSKELSDKMGLNTGLSMDYSDDGGLDISPNISISHKTDDEDPKRRTSLSNKFSIGSGFNSRSGLKGLTLSHSGDVNYTKETKKTKKSDKKARKVTGFGMPNSSITYSKAMPSYTPGISTPFANVSVDFSFRTGMELFGMEGAGTLRGSFNSQYIPKDKMVQTKKGYGYLYEQEISSSENLKNRDVLLDFNRENTMPLMKTTPYLPWANHSFDMYSVSAQGVGGTYRLHRNDLPVLHDDYRDSKTIGGRLGLDLSGSNAVKAGLNLGFNFSRSESGYWSNSLSKKTGFISKADKNASVTNPNYEPTYFREVNELVPQNINYMNLVGGENLITPVLAGYEIAGALKDGNNPNQYRHLSNTKKNNASGERTVRNNLFSYHTAAESDFCLDKKIKIYSKNSKVFTNGQLKHTTISRLDGERKESHISEVEVVAGDGSRHVFGIPAYNNSQVEKSFRVNESKGSTSGLVGYTPGIDNQLNKDQSDKNKNDIDRFYSSVTTPGYAHSYLLTGVLSPDYVDLSGNGISDDDLGSAVKINYTRTHTNYGWRTPYQENKAKYAKGLETDIYDAIGSYVYGKKELWHMHSIEGKTHVAFFIISKRKDGLGVKNENGLKDYSSKLYKLDRIELYSKRELKEYGDDAVAIKKVHFEYDYELCEGVENQVNTTLGKLTLKEIYFTYGNSFKGKLNSYKFHYDNTLGANYHILAYDRWGTYSNPQTNSALPTNAEFPYTKQDQATADQYAAIWNLNKIELPSGGVINVDYEADDYGYVQDRRAMRMFMLKDFGRWSKDHDYFIRSSQLYKDGLEDVLIDGIGKIHNDIIFFNLEEDVPDNQTGVDIIRNEYLKGMKEIQVTANLEINSGNYEYVKTYVTPEYVNDNGRLVMECGVADGGATGWVRVRKVHIGDSKKQGKKTGMINPIVKAGFDYTRLNLNYLIYPNSDRNRNEEGVNLQMLGSFLGFFNDLATMAVGPNRMLLTRKFCQDMNINKSWIRLNDPNKVKVGGGHRVKSIRLSDNWDAINSQDIDAINSEYGQVYDYTIAEQSETGLYDIISSGVATYEPFIGRDENPFVTPLFFDQKRPGVPDDRFTFEYPIGESFFPGASIGYSKVTVKSLEHIGQAKQHRTGYQVTEFYTYKDHPTIVQASDIDRKFTNDNWGAKLLSLGPDVKKASAAQGYLIVLNDMHGKPKSNWSYDENDVLLSGIEYEYQINDDGTLNSEVLGMKDGVISAMNFGVNVDFSMDSRFMKDEFFSANGDINLDVFAAGVIPIFVPTLWPDISTGITEVKTMSVLKVVRKTGLLMKTTAHKEGSKILTQNMLFDGKTGSVLLTSIQNEFGDNIYSFNYPAHWVYEQGMGQAFQNWGLEIKGLKMSGGELVSTNSLDLTKVLFPGDVCLLNRPGKFENKKVWVNYTTTNKIVLIDKRGYVMHDSKNLFRNDFTTLRVLRSGRKNMAGVSIGSVTSMENPLINTGGTYTLDFTEVLATSAVEYKDEWKTDLSLFPVYNCDTIATSKLITHLAKIDTLINQGYFLDTTLNTIYNLDTCNLACASGFTYNPNTGYCEKFDTASATYSGQSYQANKAVVINVYGSYGSRFYNTTPNDQYPLNQSTAGTYLDASSNTVSQEFRITNNEAWDPSDYKEGRLNLNGIWPTTSWSGDPVNTWIGFSECFEVDEKKNYYIGIGADNKTRVRINGEEFVNMDANIFADQNFKYWNVFPVELEQGFNIIEMEGLNVGGIASFGAEVYDATKAQVQSFTTQSELEDALIFSTKYLDGTYFHTSSNSNYGYQCPAGYSLNLCSDSIMCSKIQREYVGFCECPIILNTNGYPTKDILDVLSYSSIDDNTANLNVQVKNEFDDIDTINISLYTPCDTLFTCQTICELEEYARTVNPFLNGMRGNWRPFKSWNYVEDRSYDAIKANPQEDGAFASYGDFWTKSGTDYVPNYSLNKWVWTNEITEFSPFGMELENKDPLGRYSSALYGYSQTLPTAVASNTMHRQLFYEGFEEYAYMGTIWDEYICPQTERFYSVSVDSLGNYFYNDGKLLDKDISHSGNVSLSIKAGDSLVQEVPLTVPFNAYPDPFLAGQYITDADDQIIPFRPTEGQYVISLWVHEAPSLNDTLFDQSLMRLEFEDGTSLLSSTDFYPSGLIISGWQRIYAEFTVPPTAVKMAIKYVSMGEDSWFDDMRIFPYNGSMKSYAYDSRTLRLMAEMDENNYATFYEYDLEGNLVRIKKETERGIKTLQESRQHQTSNR
ncbi:MAG: hypothetical protein COA58_13465 [Bacteroidetes bacterium]|nr:MAG: hypothetical protein COA58_13465 [Bacteroidota bacterium]